MKVIYFQTPPLREIADDIPLLANHFLEKHCKSINLELKSFTPAALQCLMRYTWSDNNEVKRLIAFVRGKTITKERLQP